jgi:hypothetical protein
MMECRCCCQPPSEDDQPKIPSQSNGQPSSPSIPLPSSPPSAHTISRGRQDTTIKGSSHDDISATAAANGTDKKDDVHQEKSGDGSSSKEGNDCDSDMQSLYFDAFQSFSDSFASLSYPPTSSMIRSSKVSMLHPETLLSRMNLMEGIGGPDMISEEAEEENVAMTESSPSVIPDTCGGVHGSVFVISKQLKEVRTGGVRHGHGYPGELNERELEMCLRFRQELKKRDSAYREIVTCFAPVEDEAFALCRFLRAAQFDVDELFRMFDENGAVNIWKEARMHQFYQDFEKVYNCPFQILATQFPMVISGLAKNGATVNYFKTGDINIDGIECITDLPSLAPFIWYLLYEHTLRRMERLASDSDPRTTTVLAEKVLIADLKGMPTGLFSPRGMEFIKAAAVVTRCFPEILNRMYLLNVPTSFSMFWGFLKMFMKPRTIKKIGFFANANKAKVDLLRYVDSHALLSDYGGTGPSFYEEFATRQAEMGSTHSRYIVELVTVSKKGSPEFSFALQGKESISSIVIYSKSDVGTEFSLKNMSRSEVVIPPTLVSRKTSGVTSTHYSVSLLKSGDSHNVPSGPGKFAIHAEGTKDKVNFLVAVSLADDGVSK